MITEETAIVKRPAAPCDALTRHRDADWLTRTLIAAALGISPDAVTTDDRFAWGVGWLDEGGCCVNHRFEFTRALEATA